MYFFECNYRCDTKSEIKTKARNCCRELFSFFFFHLRSIFCTFISRPETLCGQCHNKRILASTSADGGRSVMACKCATAVDSSLYGRSHSNLSMNIKTFWCKFTNHCRTFAVQIALNYEFCLEIQTNLWAHSFFVLIVAMLAV